MFDHQQGIALVPQVAHDIDHAADVPGVQPDARFVHDEQRIDEAGAQTTCQVDPLHLAPTEGASSAVEREIPQPHPIQIPQPRLDLGPQHFRGRLENRTAQLSQQHGQPSHRHLPPVWQRRPLNTKIQRLRLQAAATTRLTRRVGSVPAQKDTDVHLVDLGFTPFEKPADAVPVAMAPRLLQIRTLAVNHPLLVRRRQILKGYVHIHPAGPSAPHQVILTLLHHIPLKGTHYPTPQTE